MSRVMTDYGVVVVCDYDEEPGHPEVIEAVAVVLGADGLAYVCGSERCASAALDDVGESPQIHPLYPCGQDTEPEAGVK